MKTDFDSRTILLVEDNEDDVFIFSRAIKQGRIPNPIQVASDGDSAIAYLKGAENFSDRTMFPLPFLILLDLKMPGLGGMDVLKWIREQPHLEMVSVIMLTSSAEHRDIARAYQLGARSYLVKPPTAAILTEIMNTLRISEASAKERLKISVEKFP